MPAFADGYGSFGAEVAESIPVLYGGSSMTMP